MHHTPSTLGFMGELTGVSLLVDGSHSLEVVDTVDGCRRLLEPKLRLVLVRERPTTNNPTFHYINTFALSNTSIVCRVPFHEML